MPLNILLADDSVPAQNMGKKILHAAGYEVITVSNGLEALRKIQENPPNLAILDVFMPGYTGVELCERLRAAAATAAMPIILAVGKLEPFRPEDGRLANAIVVKPFSAAELLSSVQQLLGSGPAMSDVVAPPPPPRLDEPFLDLPEEQPLFVCEPSTSQSRGPLLELDPAAYQSAPESTPVMTPSGDVLFFDPDAQPTPFEASVFASASEPQPPLLDDLELPQSAATTLPDVASAIELHPLDDFSAAPAWPHGPEGDPHPAHVASVSGAYAAEPQAITTDEQMQKEVEASEMPILDPLLELSEERKPTPPPLLMDEAARLAAFEALFNSDDPLPLEEPAPAVAEVLLAATPTLAPPRPPMLEEAPPPAPVNSAPEIPEEPVAQECLPAPAEFAGEEFRAEPLAEPAETVPEFDLDPALELPAAEVDEPVSPLLEMVAAPASDEAFLVLPDELELDELEPELAQPAPVVEASATDALPDLDLMPPVEPAELDAPSLLAPEMMAAEVEDVEIAPDPLLETDFEVPAASWQQPAVVAEEPPVLPGEPLPEDELALEIEAPASLAAEPKSQEAESGSAALPEPLDEAVSAASYVPAGVHEEVDLAATPETPQEATPLEAAMSVLGQAATALPSPAVLAAARLAHAESEEAEAEPMTETERVQQAIETVFERFKPLLVAAIVRELARRD